MDKVTNSLDTLVDAYNELIGLKNDRIILLETELKLLRDNNHWLTGRLNMKTAELDRAEKEIAALRRKHFDYERKSS